MIPVFTTLTIICIVITALTDSGLSRAFGIAAIICAFGGI